MNTRMSKRCLLVLGALALLLPCAFAQTLSRKTDPPDRAVSAGRRRRLHRPHRRAEADRTPRPAGRDRQPRRSERHRRARSAEGGAARRLHDRRRLGGAAHGESVHLREASARHAARLHAHREHGELPAAARHAPVAAGEEREGSIIVARAIASRPDLLFVAGRGQLRDISPPSFSTRWRK